MSQYTFKDIEEFLLDDDFFQWAKYGSSNNSFDIVLYRQQHPGCEEKIELAIAMIRTMKVVEGNNAASQSYKMHSFMKMMSKHQQIVQQEQYEQQKQERTFRNRRVITYAASIAALLLMCVGSYYLLSEYQLPKKTELTSSMIDSLSQSNQIQVLLDGKQAVSLDKNNAEIRVDKDGTVIVDNKLVVASKGEKVSVNQIVVPYGRRSKIILPDGSSLWINSGSCISYHSDFATNRRLNVQGEVYLDVKKDPSHPFVVKTNHLEVNVLGTAFNITDYSKDSQPVVVLVRGSVDVKVDNRERKRMIPNQRLAIENGIVEINDVDVYNYICWKDDIMNFDGQKLSSILKSLSRYYNIKIEITGNLKDEICYGSLDLNCTLDEVLESISLTTPFKIVKQGAVIYISSDK